MLLDPHLVLPRRCKVERLRARQLDELTRAKWLGFNRGSRCLEMMPTKQWEDIPTTCKKWQDSDRCLWFQVPSPHLIVFFVIFLWGAALCMIEVYIYIYMYTWFQASCCWNSLYPWFQGGILIPTIWAEAGTQWWANAGEGCSENRGRVEKRGPSLNVFGCGWSFLPPVFEDSIYIYSWIQCRLE